MDGYRKESNTGFSATTEGGKKDELTKNIYQKRSSAGSRIVRDIKIGTIKGSKQSNGGVVLSVQGSNGVSSKNLAKSIENGLNGAGFEANRIGTYVGESGTSGDGEANLKINRLNDQIDAVEATKAKESEYSITLVAHQDESIEFKGVEIPDVIGHAFVIMRGPNGEFAKGFWPSDGASFDDFISDTSLGGALSDEGDYHSRFKSWQATGKDPKGGQFAFRSFALTKAQYQSGVSAISNWNSNPYMGQSRMCGSFATHVLRATGQSYGNSKTPYYLFYDMGGSFDKN